GPPVVVKYNNVDPSSAQGAAVLYKRIRVAAVSICSPVDHGTPLSRQHEQACVQKVVARAVTDVGSAALSAVYAANYGGPVPNTITASRWLELPQGAAGEAFLSKAYSPQTGR